MIALLLLLFLLLLAFLSFSHLSLKVFLCRAMAGSNMLDIKQFLTVIIDTRPEIIDQNHIYILI
jgi:hypothetical protein